MRLAPSSAVAIAFATGLVVSPFAQHALSVKAIAIKIPPQPKDDVVLVN